MTTPTPERPVTIIFERDAPLGVGVRAVRDGNTLSGHVLGTIVVKVYAGSQAEELGVQANRLIISLNGVPMACKNNLTS